MGKVFFDVAMSLDGLIAGENRSPTNPLGDRGIELHNWMFAQKAFLEHIEREGGEDNNIDNDMIKNVFARAGAYIMGKRMFEEGEVNWPENAPFHAPVFVLTHEKREPWVRKGGTTFYFVNEPIEDVLQKARDAAKGKDVRISGGGNAIQQYINAGLIDEFTLHMAPMTLGNGIRLFENIDKDKFIFEPTEVIHSPRATHLFYKAAK